MLEGKVVIKRGVTGAFFGSNQEDVLSISGKSVEKKYFLDLGPRLKLRTTNKTDYKGSVEGKPPLSETDRTHILLEAALKLIQEEKLMVEKANQQMMMQQDKYRKTLSQEPETMKTCWPK